MAKWVIGVGILAVSLVALIVHARTPERHASSAARPSGVEPSVSRRRLIGRSVRGRPLVVRELGNRRAGRTVLVVGCIHGDERAGIEVVRRLRAVHPPRHIDLWVLADLNPDGARARTRQNADGVDLNRNFPFAWRPLGRRGDQQYSGPRPLSEPEARAARALIMRLRPAITVWFHQPLALVDESGGSVAIERRFARIGELPVRRLTRYPGSVAGWENHVLPGATSFVVELPRGRPALAPVVRAVLALR